jgi:hypothetical protein
MSIGRNILVTLVAVSVAILPLAGAMVRAEPARMSMAGMTSDCCPHSKPCDKKNDCGSVAGCSLKCSNFSGLMVSAAVAPLNLAADLAPVFARLSFHSNPFAPPLPPPRV